MKELKFKIYNLEGNKTFSKFIISLEDWKKWCNSDISNIFDIVESQECGKISSLQLGVLLHFLEYNN